MTLASVAPYDETAVSTVGDHAVVVGGSVAGLLAARVLADAYESVTLLERDPLPDEPVARRGVPQADHVHVMLEPARVVLNDLFDGYQDELAAEGGVVMDASTQLHYYDCGDYLADAPSELLMACASRPLFEQVARRRVLATDDVTVRDECQFVDYLTDDGADAVEGVAFRDERGDRDELTADLVVDATGRSSRTHDWLGDNGYPTPPVDNVTVDLAYSTVTVDRPPEATHGYLCAPSAPNTRGGTAVPVEGDRWVVTLFGFHGDHPPADREGFAAYADSLPTPEIGALLAEREWLVDDPRQYPFPSSQWRHYEALDRFPDGLVVTGDAVASFNPIYGQGMSAAALDALQLHHALAAGGTDVGPRFFDRVADHLDVVWRTAVGADFAFAETTGPEPFGTGLLNRYVDRVVTTAHDDPVVAEAFVRVLRLERSPTTLFRPRVAARVLSPL